MDDDPKLPPLPLVSSVFWSHLRRPSVAAHWLPQPPCGGSSQAPSALPALANERPLWVGVCLNGLWHISTEHHHILPPSQTFSVIAWKYTEVFFFWHFVWHSSTNTDLMLFFPTCMCIENVYEILSKKLSEDKKCQLLPHNVQMSADHTWSDQ